MSVVLDPEILQSIEELADREQRSPSQIVADALQLYKSRRKKKISGVEFLLSIAGQGESDEEDVSERDEEILASEVDPIRGWGVVDKDRDST
jgi:predicted transcriptional regulator